MNHSSERRDILCRVFYISCNKFAPATLFGDGIGCVPFVVPILNHQSKRRVILCQFYDTILYVHPSNESLSWNDVSWLRSQVAVPNKTYSFSVLRYLTFNPSNAFLSWSRDVGCGPKSSRCQTNLLLALGISWIWSGCRNAVKRWQQRAICRRAWDAIPQTLFEGFLP